jgi:hypothetical protein
MRELRKRFVKTGTIGFARAPKPSSFRMLSDRLSVLN